MFSLQLIIFSDKVILIQGPYNIHRNFKKKGKKDYVSKLFSLTRNSNIAKVDV
jgi:hypothetical protein